jgi:hypothetical protein
MGIPFVSREYLQFLLDACHRPPCGGLVAHATGAGRNFL